MSVIGKDVVGLNRVCQATLRVPHRPDFPTDGAELKSVLGIETLQMPEPYQTEKEKTSTKTRLRER